MTELFGKTEQLKKALGFAMREIKIWGRRLGLPHMFFCFYY